MNPAMNGSQAQNMFLPGLTHVTVPVAQTVGKPVMADCYSVKREHHSLMVNKRSAPPVDLYLCDTGNSKDTSVMNDDAKERTSVHLLEKAYQSLVTKKIKDSLSSFVPNIPGEFDSVSSQESTLRALIDRPPIGGREFLPLSDQSLRNFRLHPGALPDQYRLDPPTETHRHHKKKKKHKHKNVDKSEGSSLDNYSPVVSREQSPSLDSVDPCDFIKSEHTENFFKPSPPSHVTPHLHSIPPSPSIASVSHHVAPATIVHSAAGLQQQGVVIPAAQYAQLFSQPSVIVGGTSKFTSALPGIVHQMPIDNMKIPKTKKSKHNGEKRKERDVNKDKKKKKKKKHHADQPLPSQIPPSSVSSSMGGPPPLISTFPPRPPN